MRTKTLAVIPILALLGACAPSGPEFTPAKTTDGPGRTKEIEDPAPIKPVTPVVPKESTPGSRGNPHPIGTKVTSGEWDVTLGAPANGTAAVLSENPYNSPPPQGQEFWLVPITVTYVGTESADPFWELDLGFVGDNARTYDGGECGVTPDDWMHLGELYPGGTASGYACLSVPAGAPGLFTLSPLFGEPVFFDHTPA